MAILIEGINIPEGNPITINIYRNGTWVNAYTTEDGNAIEVPEPHGRLIDADALCASHKEVCSRSMKFNLDLAPTVIPASEAE